MAEKDLVCYHTGKFGWIYPDSIHFNDQEKLPGNFVQFKVTKIWIWTGTKNGKKIINGLQFFYRNMVDGKEFTPGEHKGNANLEGKEEIVLESNEYLVDFHIRIDQEVTQIGFTTNKKDKQVFGGETGEDKIINLKEKDAVIFAPYGCYKDNLQSCGVYWYNRKEYAKKYFAGYFELRYLVQKKQGFKEAAEKLKLDESNKVLLKVCSLPPPQFNAIIRFCLN